MHLRLLPNDVLEQIVMHLGSADLFSFIVAILGFAPNLGLREEFLHVPICIRHLWFNEVVMDAFESHVRSLADQALFHARDAASMLLLVDWSEFSKKPIFPIAQYSWARASIVTSSVIVHHGRMRNVVRECLDAGRCAIRLTFHTHIEFDREHIMIPTPVLHHVYNLYPHFILE